MPSSQWETKECERFEQRQWRNICLASKGTMVKLASSHIYSTLLRREQQKKGGFELTTSISVFEWPILQTIQPFFSLSKCSLRTTCLLPRKRHWLLLTKHQVVQILNIKIKSRKHFSSDNCHSKSSTTVRNGKIEFKLCDAGNWLMISHVLLRCPWSGQRTRCPWSSQRKN